jgi:hypothetical protein
MMGEHWLRVFKNMVMRKIFGPKRNEVTGERKKLYTEELYDMYSTQKCYLGNLIKRKQMGGACGTYEEKMRRIQRFGGET